MLAPIGKFPGPHLARFQRHDAGVGTGRVERLARPGQFDLLEPVRDQDRDFFRQEVYRSSTAPEFVIIHSPDGAAGWRAPSVICGRNASGPLMSRGTWKSRAAPRAAVTLREAGAVAVVGARPAPAAFSRLRPWRRTGRSPRRRPGRRAPWLLAVAAAPVGGGARDGRDVERVAGDAAPDPGRRVVRGQDADAGCDLAHAVGARSGSRCPSMPSARPDARGAATSAKPSAMENRPSPRASVSVGGIRPGRDGASFGFRSA